MGPNNNQIHSETYYDDFHVDPDEIILKKNGASVNLETLETIVENRQQDRRKADQRHRTAEDKKVTCQEVGNDPEVDINNHERLNLLSDISTLTGVFEKDNLLIKRFKNWTVTLKHAPFSDKDLMVVYTGKSSKLTNIGALKGHGVIGELFQILQCLLIGTLNSGFFNPDNEQLCIGNNITIKPGSGEAQSLREPHIHFSIFSTIEGVKNNVRTTIERLGDHKNIFPLNPVNLELIRLLQRNLKNEGIETKRTITLDNQDFLALEIELGDKNYFLGDNDYILRIYREINKFNKSLNLGTFNKLLKGADSTYEHDRISYSVGFSYRDGKLIMVVRYTYRNKELGERGGSAANFLQIVSRKAGIPPPNLTPFKDNIKKILDDKMFFDSIL